MHLLAYEHVKEDSMVVVGISLQFHRYYSWQMLEHGCCGDFSAIPLILCQMLEHGWCWECPKVAHVPSGLTEVIILGHEAVGDNRERSKIYLGERCANRSSWLIGVPNACAKCSQLFREQRCAQQRQMLGKCTTTMQYLTTLSRSSGKHQPFMHAKKSLKLWLFSLYLRPSLVCVVVSFMCCVFAALQVQFFYIKFSLLKILSLVVI